MALKIHKTLKQNESPGLEATEEYNDETRDEIVTSYVKETFNEKITYKTGGSYVEATVAL